VKSIPLASTVDTQVLPDLDPAMCRVNPTAWKSAQLQNSNAWYLRFVCVTGMKLLSFEFPIREVTLNDLVVATRQN
jgi:hypothetical protein